MYFAPGAYLFTVFGWDKRCIFRMYMPCVNQCWQVDNTRGPGASQQARKGREHVDDECCEDTNVEMLPFGVAGGESYLPEWWCFR